MRILAGEQAVDIGLQDGGGELEAAGIDHQSERGAARSPAAHHLRRLRRDPDAVVACPDGKHGQIGFQMGDALPRRPELGLERLEVGDVFVHGLPDAGLQLSLGGVRAAQFKLQLAVGELQQRLPLLDRGSGRCQQGFDPARGFVDGE